MEREQMIFFRSYFEAGMCIQNPKERLAFFEAIVNLGLNGREIPLTGMANAIFVGIKPNIQRSIKRAESRSAKNCKGGECNSDVGDTNGMTNGTTTGWNKSETRETTFAGMPYIGKGEGIGIGLGLGVGEGEGEGWGTASAADTRSLTKPSPFVEPTVDEVRAYCVERGNAVDPERFVDYYAACGWKVGRNIMQDWKAAVRRWERNGIADEKPKEQREESSSFDRDAFFEAAVRQSLERHRKKE